MIKSKKPSKSTAALLIKTLLSAHDSICSNILTAQKSSYVWAGSISARWTNYHRYWSCHHHHHHHHHMSRCNISAGSTGQQYIIWSSNPWMGETSMGFPDCGISCVPCKSKVQNIPCKIQGCHPSILLWEYEGESVENQASEGGQSRCKQGAELLGNQLTVFADWEELDCRFGRKEFGRDRAHGLWACWRGHQAHWCYGWGLYTLLIEKLQLLTKPQWHGCLQF